MIAAGVAPVSGRLLTAPMRRSCIVACGAQRLRALPDCYFRRHAYGHHHRSRRLYGAGGFVRVAVSDNGIGILTNKHGSLFQRFQRAGQERGAIEGTGMGLAISKRLAEMMNGTIGFRSVWTEGSEFWVDLPVCVCSR